MSEVVALFNWFIALQIYQQMLFLIALPIFYPKVARRLLNSLKSAFSDYSERFAKLEQKHAETNQLISTMHTTLERVQQIQDDQRDKLADHADLLDQTLRDLRAVKKSIEITNSSQEELKNNSNTLVATIDRLAKALTKNSG